MAQGGDFAVSDSRRPDTKCEDTVPGISSLYLGSEYVEPIVCSEHDQEIKYFCKTHMLELCLTCRKLGHKNCETVIDIEQAAKETFSDDHGGNIIESVKELREQFEGCRNTAEALKNKLPGKRQKAIDSVKQTRKCINDYLDQLEADAFDEIDQVFKKESESIDESINICGASDSSLTATISRYEKAVSSGSKEEQFLEINRATKQTKQYCNMLLDMCREMSDIKIMFEKNDKISDLRDILHNLGTVSVSRSLDQYISAQSAVIYTGDILFKKISGKNEGGGSKSADTDSDEDIDEAGDKDLPVIKAFDMLPDGRRLVLTTYNTLQLYSKYGMFLTELSLPAPTDEETFFSCVLIGKKKSMISSGRNKLIIVEISDQLIGKIVTASYEIATMTNYGKDIVAICSMDEKITIAIIDTNLNIKREIMQDDGTLFEVPAFLAVNTEQNIVNVLDFKKGCYGITMDGQVLFHYHDTKADGYLGLAIASDGLFIGAGIGDNAKIQKLSFGGNREACTDFGDAYPLKVVENELVIYTISEDGSSAFLQFYFLLK